MNLLIVYDLFVGADMTKILGICLSGLISFSAIEIPLDDQLTCLSLKKGIEVWSKGQIASSSLVACRFIGQDPLQGKPQIFDLDCSAETFEEELSDFLDYCEEEIEKKGGASLGVVAVGAVDTQGFHSYLANRYDHSEIRNRISEEPIQLIPNANLNEFDVLLSYPTALFNVRTDEDLKKLWVFYLIQAMAENRFKKAATEAESKWIAPDETRYMLPAYITVGHGVQKNLNEENLLKSFLSAIQVLKAKGFTDSELADSKSQLVKHLNRFYSEPPSEQLLADYYASHLAASLPCADYSSFMALSFQMIPEISMIDIAEMLKSSFKDDTRQVVIRYPERAPISATIIQTTLGEYVSDNLEFSPEDAKPVLDEARDAFSQLLITDDEQKMIRSVIHTVAETNPIKLGFIRSDLEKKRLQLLHIHPLRSIATMFTDPYTKQCVAEMMDSFFKWKSFISDFSKRMNEESQRGNLQMYIQGFSLTVRANPDQVRLYINNKEWEKLVKYLIKLNN